MRMWGQLGLGGGMRSTGWKHASVEGFSEPFWGIDSVKVQQRAWLRQICHEWTEMLCNLYSHSLLLTMFVNAIKLHFFSFVHFYWNSSFFPLVLFDPFCFFIVSLSPLSCILKNFLNKYTVGICEHSTNKSFCYSWQERDRERKKGGSKEGEWETGEALAARKQSWCCWFHWVYWERRAARVTSANNTELQSQEVCVWIHLVKPPFPFTHLFRLLFVGF